jgi:CRISPR/Cas system-associated exonuclease Cas4 (RecB family)
MDLTFPSYPFTPILGWSISRYELFDKCKRQYFYTYYSKYVKDVPSYRMSRLRELTSVPLETGNVVHDVLEAFLKRLQKSDRNIDEERFISYARDLVKRYFSEKTFIEQYYLYDEHFSLDRVYQKVETCLRNFMGSTCFNWIFMVALHNRNNWIIEPAGYGETRLAGMKVYSKMDFLLPVDECIYILDWKTGNRDEVKHARQLIGYSAAASALFNVACNRIFPRIVYLYPEFDEMEFEVSAADRDRFFEQIKDETAAMYAVCRDVEKNIPLPIDAFPMSPSPSICRQCRYRELCFPQWRQHDAEKKAAFDE